MKYLVMTKSDHRVIGPEYDSLKEARRAIDALVKRNGGEYTTLSFRREERSDPVINPETYGDAAADAADYS